MKCLSRVVLARMVVSLLGGEDRVRMRGLEVRRGIHGRELADDEVDVGLSQSSPKNVDTLYQIDETIVKVNRSLGAAIFR